MADFNRIGNNENTENSEPTGWGEVAAMADDFEPKVIGTNKDEELKARAIGTNKDESFVSTGAEVDMANMGANMMDTGAEIETASEMADVSDEIGYVGTVENAIKALDAKAEEVGHPVMMKFNDSTLRSGMTLDDWAMQKFGMTYGQYEEKKMKMAQERLAEMDGKTTKNG